MRLMRVRGLTFVLWLNACYTWRPVELAPTPTFRETERIRVVRSDGTRTELAAPLIVDDSLVGHRSRPVTRVAIPTTDIKRVEVRKLNGVRTALVVGGVAAAVYLALAAYAVSQIEYDLPLSLDRAR